jgi:hypothetical protein
MRGFKSAQFIANLIYQSKFNTQSKHSMGASLIQKISEKEHNYLILSILLIPYLHIGITVWINLSKYIFTSNDSKTI